MISLGIIEIRKGVMVKLKCIFCLFLLSFIVQFFYFYVAHQIPEHYFFKKILVKVSIEKVVKRSVQTTRLIAKTQQNLG